MSENDRLEDSVNCVGQTCLMYTCTEKCTTRPKYQKTARALKAFFVEFCQGSRTVSAAPCCRTSFPTLPPSPPATWPGESPFSRDLGLARKGRCTKVHEGARRCTKVHEGADRLRSLGFELWQQITYIEHSRSSIQLPFTGERGKNWELALAYLVSLRHAGLEAVPGCRGFCPPDFRGCVALVEL